MPVHEPFEERAWLLLPPEERFLPGAMFRLRCYLCGRQIAERARTNHEREHLLEHLAVMSARPPELPPRRFLRPRARAREPEPVDDGWHHADVEVVAATDKALLIHPHNERGPIASGAQWVPRRFIRDGKRYKRDDRDLMLIETWIARDRGWCS